MLSALCLYYTVTISALCHSVMCFWSWWRLRGTMSEIWVQWLRWKNRNKQIIKYLNVVVLISVFCISLVHYKWADFCPLRATWAGWKRKEFQMTWEEKTRSSLETSIRSTTGTKSMLAFLQLTCTWNPTTNWSCIICIIQCDDRQVKSCISLSAGLQFFPGRAWEVFGGSWKACSFICQTGETPLNICVILMKGGISNIKYWI